MKPLNSQVTAQSGHGGESNYASIQGHTLVMMLMVMTIMHTMCNVYPSNTDLVVVMKIWPTMEPP